MYDNCGIIAMYYKIRIKLFGYVLILFSAIQIFSCSDRIPLVNRINSKEELPTVSIDNLETTYTEDGLVKGKLMARLAESYEGVVESYVDFKKGISIIAYDKDYKIKNSLTADRAIYYQKKKTWEATGNVVITNINGDVFRTSKLYGDDKEKKFFTDKLVKITKSDGTVMYAKSGFESNSDFTMYQYINVSGKIFVKDEFLAGSDSTATPVN
jgi:LPS export ABC transporter protein LptC